MKVLIVTIARLGLVVLAICVASLAQISGVVTDTDGRAIVGTRVESGTTKTLTDSEGVFRIDRCNLPCTVQVSAEGFAARQVILTEPHSSIKLQPSVVTSAITVTAERTRTPLAESSQSTVILAPEDLSAAPAPTLDDVLRQVPGFSLFRRNGSRSANPTTQGASLRGIGGSGASRVLVLRDGVPINDPFGGWVYWSRLAELGSSVEVVQGGASHLYGGSALGGVIQQLSAQPASSWLNVATSSGNQSTGQAEISTGWFNRKAALGGSFSFFNTDGYIPTPIDERGAADALAGSRHFQTRLQPRVKFSERTEWASSAEFFHESRTNGTRLQDNHTDLWQIETSVMHRRGPAQLQGRLYGSGQSYDQAFSALSADRNTESLTRAQQVPAQQLGGSIEVAGSTGAHTWVLGSDLRHTRGRSDENILSSGTLTSMISNGAQQLTIGGFASDRIALGRRWLLSAALRVDQWRNVSAESRSFAIATQTLTVTPLTDRANIFVSPRLGILFQASSSSTISVSGYRSFRAPSLNELYRPFRVGNVLTLANDALREEALTGVEATYRHDLGRWAAQLTGFWMRVNDPVTNLTVSVTPALITRLRSNLGVTHSAGLDATITLRPMRDWNLRGGYQFSHATVLANPANPALVGLRVPQVPLHTVTLQSVFMPRKWTVSTTLRASSAQFDDDLNIFPLEPFATVDVLLQRSLSSHVALFGAAENIFNSRYEVARTPIRALASPALVRVGLKLHFPGKEVSPRTSP
jgi:outer membrane receptor protein involved in Fe transport